MFNVLPLLTPKPLSEGLNALSMKLFGSTSGLLADYSKALSISIFLLHRNKKSGRLVQVYSPLKAASMLNWHPINSEFEAFHVSMQCRDSNPCQQQHPLLLEPRWMHSFFKLNGVENVEMEREMIFSDKILLDFFWQKSKDWTSKANLNHIFEK